jgi:tubulin polyglutamylase TTLL6/13
VELFSVGNPFSTKMAEAEMESKSALVDEKEADKAKRKRKTTVTLQDSLKCMSGAVRILTRRYGFQEVLNAVLWTNPDLHQVALKMIKDQEEHPEIALEAGLPRYRATNHFPGMRALCTKVLLTRHINMLKRVYPDEFAFYPNSWDLSDPSGRTEFEAHFHAHEGETTYILKPSAGLQGMGIVLAQTWAEVTACLSARKDLNIIAQEYMAEPLLLDGLKMDFRVYVCVSNLNPYTAFVFHDGLARFATKPYQRPTTANISEVYMHLTNYSLNKDSTEFKSAPKPAFFRRMNGRAAGVVAPTSGTVYCDEESASKRSIRTTLRQLEKQGISAAEFWREVDDIADKTLIALLIPLWRKYNAMFKPKPKPSAVAAASSAASASTSSSYSISPPKSNHSRCFQIIGFDLLPVMVKSKTTGKMEMKLVLLELNQNPCFRCSQSEVDFTVKQGVLGQSLELMGLLRAAVPEDQGEKPFAYTKLHPYTKYGYMLEANRSA